VQKLVLSGIFLFLIVFPSYAFADGPYLNIPPTNAFDKVHTDSGTVSASNFSMPLNIIGGTGITVSGNNGTHTVTITNTGSSSSTTKGTYNQTYANNVLVNSLGNRINFLNGTNSTVNVVDDPTRNQVNVTISSTGGSGSSGVSSLNALTGALTIACVAGNTTCTTSGGNTITINTAYNIATLNLNEIFSGITTMNNLKLGGQMNINNNSFQSLGHVYTWPNNTGTICLTNQTGPCGPGSSATYDTLVNIGTGEASVYAGNTTKTNFTFKTLKQGSHITLTNNTNDVTIATTGLLSSALLSLNGDTTAAQVVASGNTNHITVTNAGANHSIDIAFKVNNATCSSGYFVSAYSNVTGIYTCSLGNSGTITGGSNIGTSGVGFFKNSTGNTINLRNLTTTRTDLFTLTQSSNNVNIASSFKSNNITCAAGNAVTSFNNSTGTYTCSPFGSLSSAITSVNSQTGPSINIVCQTGNTTCTNSTNQIKVGFGVNPVITGLSPQTVTKPIKLNQLNASSSRVDDNDNTKKLTWLLSGMTTGKTLTIRSNQTTSQGLNIPNISTTDTLPTLGLSQTFSGTNTFQSSSVSGTVTPINSATSVMLVGDSVNSRRIELNDLAQGFVITFRRFDGSIASPTAVQNGETLGQFNFRGSGANGDYGTNNVAAVFSNAAGTFTTTSQPVNLGFQTTPSGSITASTRLTIQPYGGINIIPISDPGAGAGNDIWKSSTNADVIKYRNNANTTTYNIVSTVSATNATTGQLSGNGTGTSSASLVMDGVYATLTPANTGRITVTVSGGYKSSVTSDGCIIGIRQSTSSMGANGAAVAGSALGNNLHFLSAVGGDASGFSRTYDFTGTVGTKYFFDLSFARITGGTCTLQDINWNLVEH